MKIKKRFSIILLVLYGCTFTSNFYKMDDNITISLEINKCIKIDSCNKIFFLVNNPSKESFWLHAWHLYLYKIIDEKGKLITPYKLIEQIAPTEIDEYVLINPLGTTQLSFKTCVFEAYKLESGTKYKVFFKYKCQAAKKDLIIKTLLLELTTNSTYIEKCQ